MASYVGYAAWPVMVRQMATTALLLVHFSDSPLLGGRCGGVGSCAVWGFGVNRRQMGKTVAGPAPTACVACGRRGGRAGCVGRSPRLWVLRRGWGIYGINI
jgi:hypothetical protein